MHVSMLGNVVAPAEGLSVAETTAVHGACIPSGLSYIMASQAFSSEIYHASKPGQVNKTSGSLCNNHTTNSLYPA
jgi:hypothetical protein